MSIIESGVNFDDYDFTVLSSSENDTSNMIVPLLDKATSTGRGRTGIVTPRDRTFQIYMTGSATVKIMVTNNPDFGWYDLITGVSSNDFYESSAPWMFITAEVTSYTDGEVSVIMSV